MTNDENTARRFFENANMLSITGVDKVIFKLFELELLKTIVSGYSTNLVPFKKYALKIAHLLIEKHPWYSTSQITYEVLTLGPRIIEKASL